MKLYKYTDVYSFLDFEIRNRVYIIHTDASIGNYLLDKDTYHDTFQGLGVQL